MSDKIKIATPQNKKLWSGTDKPAGELAAKPPTDKAIPQTSSSIKEKNNSPTNSTNEERIEQKKKQDIPKVEVKERAASRVGNEGGVGKRSNEGLGKKAGLNAKQKLFVEQYMVLGNITEAAKAAGYAEGTAYSTGSRLLKYDEVQKYLKQLQEKAANKALITFNEVLKDVLKVKDRCMQEVKPLTDKKGEHLMTEDEEGNMKMAYEFDSTGALKALDIAAKLLGMYPAEKKDITVNKPVMFEGEEALD